MANSTRKKIWIRVNRKDSESPSEVKNENEVFSYEITERTTGDTIKQDILCQCCLTDLDNVVYKVNFQCDHKIVDLSKLKVSAQDKIYKESKRTEVLHREETTMGKGKSGVYTCYLAALKNDVCNENFPIFSSLADYKSLDLFKLKVSAENKFKKGKDEMVVSTGKKKLWEKEKNYRLRNHRGSLVPFTANLPSNTNTNPYILEVVKVHQNIKAKPRSIKITSYSETMKEKVTDILSRIEKLENTAPELNERREAKINNEVKDMEQMLKFLTRRMQEAEQAHWQGMFKKNPLW